MNSNSWDVYHILFLSATIAFAIPVVLRGLSLIFRMMSPNRGPEHGPSRTPKTWDRRALGRSIARSPSKILEIQNFNPRFHLGTLILTVLLMLIVLLIPTSSAIRELIRQGNSQGDFTMLSKGMILLYSIVVFASLSLFYAIKKGDLSWSRFYRKRDRP